MFYRSIFNMAVPFFRIVLEVSYSQYLVECSKNSSRIIHLHVVDKGRKRE